jgi:hypothetical protein
MVIPVAEIGAEGDVGDVHRQSAASLTAAAPNDDLRVREGPSERNVRFADRDAG